MWILMKILDWLMVPITYGLIIYADRLLEDGSLKLCIILLIGRICGLYLLVRLLIAYRDNYD